MFSSAFWAIEDGAGKSAQRYPENESESQKRKDVNTIKKATIAALALAALGLTAPAEAQHPWVLWGQQHYKWKAERPRILQIFDSRKECEKAESRAFWKEHGVTNESASPQEHVNKAEKHRKWVEETGIYTDYSCLPVGVDPR